MKEQIKINEDRDPDDIMRGYGVVATRLTVSQGPGVRFPLPPPNLYHC